MAVSVFDMFRVGIGPSSSHTVGPMRAGVSFLRMLINRNLLEATDGLKIELMGSLAATGKGHGSDMAVKLGLMGFEPETTDPDVVEPTMETIARTKTLLLGGEKAIEFDPDADIIFSPDRVPSFHTNAVEFVAYSDGKELYRRRFYSVGGGFTVAATEANPDVVIEDNVSLCDGDPIPYPFETATQLVEHAQREGLSIAEVVFANECVGSSPERVNERLDAIWTVMKQSIDRGFTQTAPLPGPFQIARRAHDLKCDLEQNPHDPLVVLDWVSAYAISVSEENASGGRVVTAPTNGAAGVIPAVLEYYLNHVCGSRPEDVRTFLLTAGAVGVLYKRNASISGAEVGCQGEVGVACSMAAAGLTAVLKGTVAQVENAAEIGMEHNLGLTCDPVAGQVQIPCIERNAVAAVKAITASRMALRGTGTHYVSLDQVIRTMLETGRDMKSKYKETSRGGLAVNIVEC